MIFVEDGKIKLNGVVLPGVIKSIEIKSAARIDEQEVEGSAAKPKQATGYEDAKITLELIVDDTEKQTKYQRFAVLQGLFRKPGQAVPQPIPIICEDTAAHGITKVLFKDLGHKQESKRDYLLVSIELWEYVPQTIKTQKASSGTATPSKGGGGGSGSLTDNYNNYLSTDRGTTPRTTKATAPNKAATTKKSKTATTPAKDTADVAMQMAKVRKRQLE